MPRLLVSPGHEQPRSWIHRICTCLSWISKDFNCLYHFRLYDWYKNAGICLFFHKKNIGTQRVNKGQSYQCLLGYFFFFEELCKFNSLTPLIKLIKCYKSYFCYHLTNLNCLAITSPIVDSYLWLHMVSPGDTELTEGDFDSCHSLKRHVLVL